MAEFGLLRVYLKDLSFESPDPLGVFQREFKPEIQLNVGVGHRQLGEDMYEVTLHLNVEAKQESTIFIAELEQAGLFKIKNATDEDKKHLLNITFPETVFPYARAIIDQSLSAGGFPPLLLAPIDFAKIAANRPAEGAKE